MTEVITLTTKKDAEGRASDWSKVVTRSLTHPPWTNLAEEPCRGTLRFSRHWILTNVCITQANIAAWREVFHIFRDLPNKISFKKPK